MLKESLRNMNKLLSQANIKAITWLSSLLVEYVTMPWSSTDQSRRGRRRRLRQKKKNSQKKKTNH
eukprot:894043-Amphidinium_carterae.2